MVDPLMSVATVLPDRPASDDVVQHGERTGMAWIPGGTFRMGCADFYPSDLGVCGLAFSDPQQRRK